MGEGTKLNQLARKIQTEQVCSIDDAMYLVDLARTSQRRCISLTNDGDAVECFRKLVKRGYYHKAVADYRTILQEVIAPLIDSLGITKINVRCRLGTLLLNQVIETFETEPADPNEEL